MTSSPVARLRRRGLLSAVAVAAVTAPLTACEDVPLERADTGGPTGDAPDPDEDLLADAVRVEALMLASLQRLLDRAPAGQRPSVRRTLDVHRAHLGLLRDGDSAPPPEARPLRSREVAAAEDRLARRHAEAAVRASSGQFARVLAGMSAGAAQQAEVWRTSGASP